MEGYAPRTSLPRVVAAPGPSKGRNILRRKDIGADISKDFCGGKFVIDTLGAATFPRHILKGAAVGKNQDAVRARGRHLEDFQVVGLSPAP